jgi:uncharacterized protein (DUF1501 family)
MTTKMAIQVLPVQESDDDPSTSACPCCPIAPDTDLSRRTFLMRALGTAGSVLAMSLMPNALLRFGSAFAATNAGRTLVVVFQRGGNDGLNTIIPYSDPQYYVMRPQPANGGIGVVPPGGGDGAGLDLPGSGFALHPSLQPFLSLYTNNTLAAVTTAGFANTLSHFTDQDTIEHGFFALQDGWLNRYLQTVSSPVTPTLRAAGFGSDLADSLRGAVLVPAVSSLSSLTFSRLGSSRTRLEGNLRAIYGQDPQLTTTNPFRQSTHALGPEMLDKIRTIEAVGPAAPQNGAVYPNTTFGRQLRDIAHIIRAGLGLEIATVDIGGWDTHDDQGAAGAAGNRQAALLADFSSSIRAFYDDLGARMTNVVLVTCTEFGRTVKQNASGGTDHGRGSVWFVLGGAVRGGLYHGVGGFPPSLTAANLADGRYIPPRVDFRDIFGEILVKHFGVTNSELAAVLPGHTYAPVGMIA